MMVEMYSRLVTQEPRPDVIALQEIRKWSEETNAAFNKLGYDCVTHKVRSAGERGGGCSILVNRNTVSAVPITLSECSNSRIEVCAAFVGFKTNHHQNYIGVACVYFPPRQDHPESDDDLPNAIRQLGDAGVELVVGDLNARHHTWCPAMTREARNRWSTTDPGARGNAVYASSLTSDWLVANSKVPTRVCHNIDGIERTSPDVVLYRGCVSCGFRVFGGSVGGGSGGVVEGECGKVTPADLHSVSDHLPIYVSVTVKVTVPHYPPTTPPSQPSLPPKDPKPTTHTSSVQHHIR